MKKPRVWGNTKEKKKNSRNNYFPTYLWRLSVFSRVCGIGEDTKEHTHFHHSNNNNNTTRNATNTLPTAKQQKVCQSVPHSFHAFHSTKRGGKKRRKEKGLLVFFFFGGLSHERIHNREGVAAPKRPISASGMNCRM